MGTIILYAYLIVGLLVMAYDWKRFQGPEFNKMNRFGKAESPMAVVYMISIILLWPIKIFYWVFKK